MMRNGMMHSNLYWMRIHQLLPYPVFRQITLHTGIDTLLWDKGISDRTRQSWRDIQVDPRPQQQGLHLPYLVCRSELRVKVKTESLRELIILKSTHPSRKLGL